MPNDRFFEWFFNSELFISSKQSQTDEIWGYYDYLKDESSRLATSRYRYWRLRNILDADPPLKIMKIGPATGTMLYVAQRHGHDVRGCDINGQFIGYAHEKYGVTIDQGRFEHIDYGDEAFDVILLRWRWPLRVASILRIHRVPFPMYAYPSRIVAARKRVE